MATARTEEQKQQAAPEPASAATLSAGQASPETNTLNTQGFQRRRMPHLAGLTGRGQDKTLEAALEQVRQKPPVDAAGAAGTGEAKAVAAAATKKGQEASSDAAAAAKEAAAREAAAREAAAREAAAETEAEDKQHNEDYSITILAKHTLDSEANINKFLKNIIENILDAEDFKQKDISSTLTQKK